MNFGVYRTADIIMSSSKRIGVFICHVSLLIVLFQKSAGQELHKKPIKTLSPTAENGLERVIGEATVAANKVTCDVQSDCK